MNGTRMYVYLTKISIKQTDYSTRFEISDQIQDFVIQQVWTSVRNETYWQAIEDYR